MELLRFTKTARRLRQIVNVFLSHGFGSLIDQIDLGRYVPFFKRLRTFGKWPPERDLSVPERLRTAFAELGPSFIKLAQLLSSRPDLITAPYAEEFRKLQDEVPPFPVAEARSIIEHETGRPLKETFVRFDDTPMAAASIAQVHAASLLDGTDVIVKVQRPGIKEQLDTDIEILLTIARLLEKHVAESRPLNPVGIVEEFSRTVKRELDFKQEARNAVRFARNFQDHPAVHIPGVFTEFLSEKVLVMERVVDGVRIDDIQGIEAMGLDRKELAAAGVDAYFKMILDDGFFHADPHPGNIFALPDGRIAFVDFGIVGRVTDEMKAAMANIFIALITHDFDKLIDEYMELGVISDGVDAQSVRRELKADLTDFLEPFYGMTLGEIDFSDYIGTVVHLILKHGIRMPTDLLLINKAMLILESIGTSLDPEFDFVAASEPYASKLIKKKLSPSAAIDRFGKNVVEAGENFFVLPRQMREVLKKLVSDELHIKLTHHGLEHLIKDMDRSSNRIAFAMVVSAILVSSAIMHATDVGPTVFGYPVSAVLAFASATFLGVWLVVSIIRSGRL